jgi:glucosamine--fructose-6-phosphate aminotransferase (isomerizing)
MAHGEITLSEIKSQPKIWAQALSLFEQQVDESINFWKHGSFDQVIFTGCGSTYYLGVIGATLLQAATGVPARAFSASELMLFPQINFDQKRKTLLICVSRSGTTRETVEAARLFRQHGSGSIAVVTCQSDSPLAQQADLLLSIDAAQEQSRVQTRSFSSMAIIITALAAALGGQDWQRLKQLPNALEKLITNSSDLMRQLGEDLSITRFVFLGSGAQYGLACEAMLKMTEMTRVPTVSYHILEFLHGPRYATDAHTLIVGLVSDSIHAEEVKALQASAFRKAHVVALAEADQNMGLSALDFPLLLESGIPEWGRVILYLPPLQMLCFHQAIQRGFDPDNLPFDPHDAVNQ